MRHNPRGACLCDNCCKSARLAAARQFDIPSWRDLPKRGWIKLPDGGRRRAEH